MLITASLLFFLVAGTGIEPVSRGYEPRELPLLYPAMCMPHDTIIISITQDFLTLCT